MMTFEVLGIIVFLNVMATIALWRQAARKPKKTQQEVQERTAAQRAHHAEPPAA